MRNPEDFTGSRVPEDAGVGGVDDETGRRVGWRGVAWPLAELRPLRALEQAQFASDTQDFLEQPLLSRECLGLTGFPAVLARGPEGSRPYWPLRRMSS